MEALTESLAAREKEEEAVAAETAAAAANAVAEVDATTDAAAAAPGEYGKVEEGSPEFFTDALRLLIASPGD